MKDTQGQPGLPDIGPRPREGRSEKNIFVIGLDEANLPTLQQIPDAQRVRFHPLLTVEELQVGEVSVAELLEKAQGVLDAFDGTYRRDRRATGTSRSAPWSRC